MRSDGISLRFLPLHLCDWVDFLCVFMIRMRYFLLGCGKFTVLNKSMTVVGRIKSTNHGFSTINLGILNLLLYHLLTIIVIAYTVYVLEIAAAGLASREMLPLCVVAGLPTSVLRIRHFGCNLPLGRLLVRRTRRTEDLGASTMETHRRNRRASQD